MPTLAINDEMEYFYTDSGAPENVANYHTLIMIHGHSFHSGTFQRLLTLAPSKNMRIISINRREFPGTTPFSDEENRVIASGNEEERYTFFQEQGISLAKFVCGVIKHCSIPAPNQAKIGPGGKEIKKGGITVGAWSLGNVYMFAMVACIDVVEEEVRNHLQAYVTGILMWDCGSSRSPKAYMPLTDQSLSAEEILPAFGKWVSSYYKHKQDPTHKLDSLLYHTDECDPLKKSTLEKLSPVELASMMEVTAEDHPDTRIMGADYVPVVHKLIMKALFDTDIRTLWKNAGFYHLYGVESPWNVTYGAWYLEDKVKEMELLNQNEGGFKIIFRAQERANHFSMWEVPEETWDAIIDCINA